MPWNAFEAPQRSAREHPVSERSGAEMREASGSAAGRGLRMNLRRRKAQQRERSGAQDGATASEAQKPTGGSG